MNALSRPSTSTSLVGDFAGAARRFAAAVASADQRAPVAACPGWSVHDVAVHLGNVHAWAATVVETGRRAPQQDDRPRSHRSRAVRQWYVAKAEDLYQVLRQTPPDSPSWTLAGDDGDAMFWQRRQLHETIVHLVDLDRAAHRPTAIEAPIAADGIDEVLTVMLPRMHRRGRVAELHAPLRLTASDTGDSWLVSPAPSPLPVQLPVQRAATLGAAPVVQRLPAGAPDLDLPRLDLPDGLVEADAVTAPAQVLYRLLWHRTSLEAVADGVQGDPDRVLGFLDSALVP